MPTYSNTTILVSDTSKTNLRRAISLSSTHDRAKPRAKRDDLNKPRKEAEFGTKSYKDGLQRAFNKAKQQIYFNPDMKYLLTLTYADNMQDLEQAQYDIKQWLKTERRNGNTNLKYIYIFEYQKRGAIHVHMICNSEFDTFINDNGYLQLEHWKHGWSSFLPIKNLDKNFKPYLYLFKYMKKTQRIGKSFVHTSRNLNNFIRLEDYEFDVMLGEKEFEENMQIDWLPDEKIKYTRRYYKTFVPYDKPYDILTTSNINDIWNRILWQRILQYLPANQKKMVENLKH